MAEDIRNYRSCDEEIGELIKEKRMTAELMTAELMLLSKKSKKDKNSKQYFKRKLSSSPSAFSQSDSETSRLDRSDSHDTLVVTSRHVRRGATFLSVPPHENVGRPIEKLLEVYIRYKHLPLSDYLRLSDKIFVSRCNKLSLDEYCKARDKFCYINHPCSECYGMVKAARLVLCLLPSICFQKIIPFCTLPYTKCKECGTLTQKDLKYNYWSLLKT